MCYAMLCWIKAILSNSMTLHRMFSMINIRKYIWYRYITDWDAVQKKTHFFECSKIDIRFGCRFFLFGQTKMKWQMIKKGNTMTRKIAIYKGNRNSLFITVHQFKCNLWREKMWPIRRELSLLTVQCSFCISK